MNCIIYHKKHIDHYIENVAVDGLSFCGSNKMVVLGRRHPFEIKFTTEFLTGDVSKVNPESISNAPTFSGQPVDGRDAVSAIVRDQIAMAYSLSDEAKISRLRLSGKLSDDDWNKYVGAVDAIVESGKQIKDKVFPKDKEAVK